jgi:hypothetical protein
VDEKNKGTHRDNCLCFKCDNFKPGQPNNCVRAQELYEYCVKYDMTTPVYECPAFIGSRFAQTKSLVQIGK